MKVCDPREFGAVLKSRRKTLGYTQQYLADCSGFSVSFISDLENGKATAELGKALCLAALLGLDLDLKVR